MEETRAQAKARGYVETVFGRRLYLPEINSPNGPRRSGAERAAINAPMQGTAADLIKMSMNQVQKALDEQGRRTRMIMQVHDELVFEVPEDEVAWIKQAVPEIMAARQASGPDVRIMCDTNCPWTIWQAIDMAHRVADADLTWLEEPVWPPHDYDGLARVRIEGGIPIAAGESEFNRFDFRELAELGAADISMVPYTRPDTEVDTEVVRDKIVCLAKLQMPSGVKVAPKAGEMSEQLASSAGAIGMTTMTIVEQSKGRIKPLALRGIMPTAVTAT